MCAGGAKSLIHDGTQLAIHKALEIRKKLHPTPDTRLMFYAVLEASNKYTVDASKAGDGLKNVNVPDNL